VADQVRAFAILGGTPAFLRALSPSQRLLVNLGRQVLTRGTFFYEEVRFLLDLSYILGSWHIPMRQRRHRDAAAWGCRPTKNLGRILLLQLLDVSLPPVVECARKLLIRGVTQVRRFYE